jgi:hypothetical protein
MSARPDAPLPRSPRGRRDARLPSTTCVSVALGPTSAAIAWPRPDPLRRRPPRRPPGDPWGRCARVSLRQPTQERRRRGSGRRLGRVGASDSARDHSEYGLFPQEVGEQPIILVIMDEGTPIARSVHRFKVPRSTRTRQAEPDECRGPGISGLCHPQISLIGMRRSPGPVSDLRRRWPEAGRQGTWSSERRGYARWAIGDGASHTRRRRGASWSPPRLLLRSRQRLFRCRPRPGAAGARPSSEKHPENPPSRCGAASPRRPVNPSRPLGGVAGRRSDPLRGRGRRAGPDAHPT